MIKHSHKKGFTLIETAVYLALYALIMTGALLSIYAIFGTNARNQTKAMLQEEGTFFVGKIDWTLTGAQTINLPLPGTSDDTLSVTKFDVSVGNPVVIAVSGGNITMSKGGNPAVVLNNSNITVVCPTAGCFTHTAASGGGINPEGLSTRITVYATTSEGMAFSQDFFTVKYLRK